ncbi:MAG: hypothetical protein ABSD76_06435 [Terriglobales bacterium]|jgi:hypothetical protein
MTQRTRTRSAEPLQKYRQREGDFSTFGPLENRFKKAIESKGLTPLNCNPDSKSGGAPKTPDAYDRKAFNSISITVLIFAEINVLRGLFKTHPGA